MSSQNNKLSQEVSKDIDGPADSFNSLSSPTYSGTGRIKSSYEDDSLEIAIDETEI